MKHSTKKPTKAHVLRFERLHQLGCIACRKRQWIKKYPVEIHHLNLGGRAGQKRRGHDHTIPLCDWHHRGVVPDSMSADLMAKTFGPSLARSSKMFRLHFGTDDELLAEVDRLIGFNITPAHIQE